MGIYLPSLPTHLLKILGQLAPKRRREIRTKPPLRRMASLSALASPQDLATGGSADFTNRDLAVPGAGGGVGTGVGTGVGGGGGAAYLTCLFSEHSM